ncbi:S-adenosyl-L-methionine-dependent methyltransferase [Calocera viscosa TUFC12733]|uniref:S-adenosyl-L-methionine-dependent methyltransferase n=1 Tax=Calocera viscosa (strain TUFC12733) TaxID=1330018 RepID=A0A167J295_CALVF|nr:S-adenosyl-L-methionine-dependent methyltransferase [Calocera viscosa TUFC12733]
MHAVMLRHEALPTHPPTPTLPLPITVRAQEIPYPLPDNEEEDRRRLDAGHYALQAYLGGNYIAPLHKLRPGAILDLGTGSGIWALEMAAEFPDAKVLGVDMLPVVARHAPPNCAFEVVNLAQEWPFPPQAFDVIHSRFCLVHLPNAREILVSALASLRPGGLLLLEEGTNALFSRSPDEIPAGIKRFYELYSGIMRARGVDGEVGPKMLDWIRESGACEEVHERILEPPMQPFTKDDSLNCLGEVLKQFLIKGYASMIPRLEGEGVTRDIVDGFVEGVSDPTKKVRGRLNWVWARKKVD